MVFHYHQEPCGVEHRCVHERKQLLNLVLKVSNELGTLQGEGAEIVRAWDLKQTQKVFRELIKPHYPSARALGHLARPDGDVRSLASGFWLNHAVGLDKPCIFVYNSIRPQPG